MSDPEEYNLKPMEEHYNDWLTDHIGSLRRDFIENHSDEFEKFCHERYNEE